MKTPSAEFPSQRAVARNPIQLRIHPHGEQIQLFLYERDFISDLIRRDLYWEMPQTTLLGMRIKRTDSILDIGANLGYYTVLMSKLAPDGVVHAFEPDAENFALLTRNCELNNCRNVSLHNIGLSNRSGKAKFFKNRDNAGDHRLSTEGNHYAETSVDLETGDRCLSTLTRVDVIKCDTQGAEADVFDGLTGLIGRSAPKPLILAEFEPTGLLAQGRRYSDLLDKFSAWGYRYHFVNWEHIFTIDQATLVSLANHWQATKSPGNLDLVLLPTR